MTKKAWAIYTLDYSGRILTWNADAERMMGHRATDVIGKHFSMFYTPDDDATSQPTSHLLAAVDGCVEYDGWRVRKDRRRFKVHVVLVPLRDRSGDLTGFVEVLSDLSNEQPKAEPRK